MTHPNLLHSPTRLSLILALSSLGLVACQTVPMPGPAMPPLPAAMVTDPAPAPADRPSAMASPVPEPGVGVAAARLNTPTADTPIAAPRDLWERIRRGLAMPDLDHPLVDDYARRFADARFFDQRAARIRLYMPLIVEEMEKRGLPLELAMLPLVESALNPHARSPVGALGFFQFMPPTARRFDLRTSRLVDDRKNLREATRAALDYLQTLHAQFGDWHLAMASYNWGEGRVQRAVNRQRAAGARADFVALADRMPLETRHYVPQIMALARLLAQPERYAARLPEVPDHNPLVEVPLQQDTDLALALRFAEIGETEFLRYIPAARPPLLLAAATPRLLLTREAAARFEVAQAAHTGPTATYRVVKLVSTTTVDAIARQHGVPAADVRAMNDIPRGMKPLQGSVLVLPALAPAGTVTHHDLVAQADLDITADVIQVFTRARKGDTAHAVAQRCGVALPQLVSWNGLSPKRVRRPFGASRDLRLWLPRESPGPCARASAEPARPAPPVAKPGPHRTPAASAAAAAKRQASSAPKTTKAKSGAKPKAKAGTLAVPRKRARSASAPRR